MTTRRMSPQPREETAWLPLLVIMAGTTVYLNSFSGVFLFDDTRNILENPTLHTLWPLMRILTGSVRLRPVTDFSFALNYVLGGPRPFGFHAANVAIHLLAALTLYGLIRRTLAGGRLGTRSGAAAPWLALAVALLWVIHPLQTASVTYIVQRAESLMGLWYLLMLYSVSRGAASPRPRRWSVIAVTACALGMASKSVMVTAPIAALLFDRACIAGSFRAAWRLRRGLHLGLATTWVIPVALAALVPPETRQTYGFSMTDVTPLAYALTQPAVIFHYLKLAVWPHPLVLDYAWPLVKDAGQALPALLAVGGLGLATLWAWRRAPALGFLGAAFFLILAPSSSIFPLVDIAFEHRMYVPLACVITLLVFGAWRLGHWLIPSAQARRGLAAALLMAVVATLGALTVRRNADYRSEMGMWRDVIAKRPTNPRARAHIGDLLVREGKLGEAVAAYRAAIRLKPDYAEVYNNLGLALERQGQIADAAIAYAEGIRLRPTYPQMHANLARVLDQQGKPAEAVAAYLEALRLAPNHAEAHAGVGALLAEQGKLSEAASHLTEAIRLNPSDGQAHHNLGVVLTRQGRMSEATAQFEAALRMRPDDAEARRDLEAIRSRPRVP